MIRVFIVGGVGGECWGAGRGESWDIVKKSLTHRLNKYHPNWMSLNQQQLFAFSYRKATIMHRAS